MDGESGDTCRVALARIRREMEVLHDESGAGFAFHVYWAVLRSLTEEDLGSAAGHWPPISEESQKLLLMLHQPPQLASRCAGRLPLNAVPELGETLENKGDTLDAMVVAMARHFNLSPTCLLKMQALSYAWKYNSFQREEDFVAVYVGASFFSHSCSSNCWWNVDDAGNFLLFVGDGGLRENEEATISYMSPERLALPTVYRRDVLAEHWLFFCTCDACAPLQPPFCGVCGNEGSRMQVIISEVDEGPYDNLSVTCDRCGKDELAFHHSYFYHCDGHDGFDLCPSCGSESEGVTTDGGMPEDQPQVSV